MPSYYLGMDQGTTGTTALLLDENWHIVSSGYREHIQRFPRPGWVEQDPELLWDCFTGAAEQAFQRAGVSPSSRLGAWEYTDSTAPVRASTVMVRAW